jgi:GNAT superfamily N-acetyltransferase
MMSIRPAQPQEAALLTTISHRSKRYWEYPDEYFEIWKDELTVTEQYITDNSVYVALKKDVVVGYYSIVEVEEDFEVAAIRIQKGFWLDHMFIEPDNIGQNIGTTMVDHLKSIWKDQQVEEIRVLADPNARGFYEKRGFRYIREYPSTIPGRTTPLLVIGL